MGYKAVRLTNPKINLNEIFHTHRLIVQAFIPNPENKLCINHKNLNNLDNSLDNLEWVSYKENTDHAIENGAMDYLFGENHWQHKLTLEQVGEIRKKWFFDHISSTIICKEYNVSRSCIQNITSNKQWYDKEYDKLVKSTLYKERQYWHIRNRKTINK